MNNFRRVVAASLAASTLIAPVAALAGAIGEGTPVLAQSSATPEPGERRDDRQENRSERRDDRGERRDDRQETRGERRDDRQETRGERRDDRQENRGERRNDRQEDRQ